MLVMNALDNEQSVMACGNTFFFKPREIKNFENKSIAWSITRQKAEYGFVELPESLIGLSYLRSGETIETRATPEELAIIETHRKQGVESYIKRLREIVYNAQVSLGRDLAQKNFKHDPRYEYSTGEVAAMKELVKYQNKQVDEDKLKVDEVKDLEKKLAEKK